MSGDSLPDSLETGELAVVTQMLVPDFAALMELDCNDTDLLQPTLAVLREVQTDQFDPGRFHFIQALAQAALKQRQPVRRVLEHKALQALRDYVETYVSAREQAKVLVGRAASETPEVAEQIVRLFEAGDLKGVKQLAARAGAQKKAGRGILAALTLELAQPDESAESAAKSSFEDELRQQEREFIQSVSGAGKGNDAGDEAKPGQSPAGELSAMRRFREALVQRNSARRVARALEDGPENPGPLNAQALIIRSISRMQALSPGYANRLVSYLETLSWLEQTGAAVAPAKSRGSSRRKP